MQIMKFIKLCVEEFSFSIVFSGRGKNKKSRMDIWRVQIQLCQCKSIKSGQSVYNIYCFSVILQIIISFTLVLLSWSVYGHQFAVLFTPLRSHDPSRLPQILKVTRNTDPPRKVLSTVPALLVRSSRPRLCSSSL